MTCFQQGCTKNLVSLPLRWHELEVMRFLIIGLALAISQTAVARIGETKGECDKRYGVGVLHRNLGEGLNMPPAVIYTYSANTFNIRVLIYKNKCVGLQYTKKNGVMIEEHEFMALMRLNGMGSPQREVTLHFPGDIEFWSQQGSSRAKKISAEYNKKEHHVIIYTEESTECFELEEEAKLEKEGL